MIGLDPEVRRAGAFDPGRVEVEAEGMRPLRLGRREGGRAGQDRPGDLQDAEGVIGRVKEDRL
jgi:hypothetical protein